MIGLEPVVEQQPRGGGDALVAAIAPRRPPCRGWPGRRARCWSCTSNSGAASRRSFCEPSGLPGQSVQRVGAVAPKSQHLILRDKAQSCKARCHQNLGRAGAAVRLSGLKTPRRDVSSTLPGIYPAYARHIPHVPTLPWLVLEPGGSPPCLKERGGCRRATNIG